MTERAVAPSSCGRVRDVAPAEDLEVLLGRQALDRRHRRGRRLSSCGRKAMPTAYEPRCGSSKPTTSRKKASGTWSRMPAPSPLSGSAPTAPRCSRLRSAVRDFSTMSCDGDPLRVATMATPQASCSARGS
jgi:hypothetical protein